MHWHSFCSLRYESIHIDGNEVEVHTSVSWKIVGNVWKQFSHIEGKDWPYESVSAMYNLSCSQSVESWLKNS